MMENPTMHPKHQILNIRTGLKVLGVLLLGALLNTKPAPNPAFPDFLPIAPIDMQITLVFLLPLLLIGMYKISQKNPTGWSLLSVFMYLLTFKHEGITAWVFILLSIWLFWVSLSWRYNIKILQKLTEPLEDTK